MMLLQDLVRILHEIEELGFTDFAVENVILDQLPVTLLHAAHARLGAAGIDAIQHIAHAAPRAEKHRLETHAFVRRRSLDTRDVTKGGENIEQVDVSRDSRAGLDARTLR